MGEFFFLIFSLISYFLIFSFYANSRISSGKLLSKQLVGLSIYFVLFSSFLFYNKVDFSATILNNHVQISPISTFFALLVIFFILVLLISSVGYLSKNSLNEFEIVFIVAFITIGTLCIIFSNSFLSLYLGLELQGLGLYVLASCKNNSSFSTEAGLKYFIIGAFGSSMLIFGISIFYGAVGLDNFTDIANFNLYGNEGIFVQGGAIFGLILILLSLILKVGGAPFHMWVPDVYEGSPTVATALFSIVPKIGLFSVILRFNFEIFTNYIYDIQGILLFSAVLSVSIGSIGALNQSSIKRVLSYSAIGHTGLLLYGISIGTLESLVAVLFYVLIYFNLVMNIFSCILAMRLKETGSPIKLISNLFYVYKSNFWLSLSFSCAIFSMAGIPPLSGFFSKFFIFLAGLEMVDIFIVCYLIFLSVVSCVYTLKVQRWVASTKKTKWWVLFDETEPMHGYLITYYILFNLFTIFFGLTTFFCMYSLGVLSIYTPEGV